MVTVLLLISLKKNTFFVNYGWFIIIHDWLFLHTRSLWKYTNRNFPEKLPANEVRLGYLSVSLSVLIVLIVATWTSSPVSHCLLASSAIKSVLSLRRLRWCLRRRLFWVLVLEFGCDPASWLWISSHCATMHVPTCPDIELFLVHMEMDVAPAHRTVFKIFWYMGRTGLVPGTTGPLIHRIFVCV